MLIPLFIRRLGVACDTVSSVYQLGKYSKIIYCGVYYEALVA